MATGDDLIKQWKQLKEKVSIATKSYPLNVTGVSLEYWQSELTKTENAMVDLQARRISQAIAASNQTRVACSLKNCDSVYTDFAQHYNCVMNQLDAIILSPGQTCLFLDYFCCKDKTTAFLPSNPKADTGAKMSTTKKLMIGGAILAGVYLVAR